MEMCVFECIFKNLFSKNRLRGSLKTNTNVYFVFVFCCYSVCVREGGGLIVLSAHYVPLLRINVSMQIFKNVCGTNIQMAAQSVTISCLL